MTVSILEAKQNLEVLLPKAAGESVVIAIENREFEMKI
jgi:hypothetical protein